jgi:putative oxidoreductase
MLYRIVLTSDSVTLAIVRVTLGIVIIAHGLQKLFGWFGGHGVGGTIQAFNEYFGLPAALTVLVICAESFGSLFLILGIFTRFMALSIGMVMVGAIYLVVGRWGFFMNWYSQPRGEGYEFHILALGIVLALLIGGGGKWSVDRVLMRRFTRDADT